MPKKPALVSGKAPNPTNSLNKRSSQYLSNISNFVASQ